MSMIKQFAFATSLLALSSPVVAGTITFGINTTATGPVTQSFTLPDAQIARALAAYKAAQGQVCDSATPPVCAAPTNLQAFQFLATRIMGDIKAITRDYEQRLQSATVTDLTPQ